MTRAARFFESVWYGAPRRRWAEILLWPVEAAFSAAVRLRAALYAAGLKRRIVLPVPVIVIGNITVGGTGKTPLLIWLAARLRERGYSPGIVSRGYGGRSAAWPRRVEPGADPREVGDEPVLIAERTGAPVAVGPDRAAAAELLLSVPRAGARSLPAGGAPSSREAGASSPPDADASSLPDAVASSPREADASSLPQAHAVDVLLSDDGLQHYRLARTVEIAVVDGKRGLGNGRCLPAGPLREPAARLARVDAIVVNGSDGADSRLPRGPRVFETVLEPSGVHRLGARPNSPRASSARRDGERRALADFAGRRVHAVAGIGHPERFFEMLERHGLDIVRHPLPDHAEIRPADLDYGGEPVLVTEKDAVKCRAFAGEHVWCVAVDFCFDPGAAGEALVDLALERLVAVTGH